jgi:electron transfer flavoprotein alpha subunit
MSVLIFIDSSEGHVKKASLEAMSYGSAIAKQLNTTAEGVILGSVGDDLTALGKYGVKKIHQINNDSLNHFDAQVYANVIAQVAESSGAKVIVFSNNVDGKAVAPRLSARLKAALVSGASSLPDTSKGFVVKKSVFSGKAFAHISLTQTSRSLPLIQMPTRLRRVKELRRSLLLMPIYLLLK